MPRVRVEFTVEPFVDGRPGPHVTAAWDAARAEGLALEVGPFSSVAEADEEAILAGVAALVRAALGAGATRVALDVTRPASPA
jgi:uncharacterized protein YqgV (UPF0045/DUF77 family)